MVHIESKFLLNIIIFLKYQRPEEKYRRIKLVLVVCPKELDKIGRLLDIKRMSIELERKD
jgi:hypothetical protein